MFSLFYCQVVAASLCFATSGVAMKFSDGLTRPLPSMLLGLLVLVGATFQTFVMRYAGLGTTYLMVLGLEAVIATVLGIVFFHESFSLSRVLAIGFIVVGVAWLHK
jgi:quaternary ammonium compound-resistance protein SugE